MSRRAVLSALPWIALALFGWLLYRDMIHDAEERGAWKAQEAVLGARVDSAAQVALDSSEAAHRANLRADRAERAKDSTDAVSRRRIAAARRTEREAVARAAEMGHTVAASFDSLRVVVPALLVALVDSTEAQHDAQVAELTTAAGALKEQARGLATMLAGTENALNAERLRAQSWESAAAETRTAFDASQALVAGLEKRLHAVEHPGILTRVRQWIPPAVIGAAVVCALRCR